MQGRLVFEPSEVVRRVSKVVCLIMVDGGNEITILKASHAGCSVKCQGDGKKEKEWNGKETKKKGTRLCYAHTRHGASSTRVGLIVAQVFAG